MTGRYRLPHPLEPFPDESLLGLAMRNAAVYRFRDPERLFRNLRLGKTLLTDICKQDPSGEVGRGVAHLLGLDEERFRRLTIWHPIKATANLLGWSVHRELVRHRRRSVCPACIAESQHHRAIWLIDIVPICARHGCWLFNACPSCGHALGWKGVGVHVCRCRQDLRQAPLVLAPDGALGAVAALDAIFHRTAEAPIGLDLGNVLQVVLRLGLFAVGKEALVNSSRRIPGAAIAHREIFPDVLAQGWAALSDWPHGFHACLDKVRSHNPPNGPAGLERSFRGLHAWLFRWARAGWGKPLAEEFARYAAASRDIACTTHALSPYGSAKSIKRADMTTREAQERLGVSPDTMSRIVERNPGMLLRSSGPGVPSLIKGSEVLRLARLDAQLLNVNGVAQLLGMCFSVVPYLEAIGLLRRLPGTDYLRENRAFRRSDVQGLLDACVGNAVALTGQEVTRRGLVTIEGASRPWRTRYEVMAALASGRLRAAAVDSSKRGIRSIRLDPSDVDAAMPHSEALVSRTSVQKEFGVKAATFLAWRRAGAFGDAEATGRVGRKGVLLFSPAVVENFRASYVRASELPTLTGCPGRKAAAIADDLIREGVAPVSGPGVDAGGQFLFRREEITPEILKQALQFRVKPPVAEQRTNARNRTDLVLEEVGRRWGSAPVRRRNLLTFAETGRTVLAVSGTRVSLVGRFTFHVTPPTFRKLLEARDAWVALIPSGGDFFLLVPFDRITWPTHQGRAEEKVKWLSIRLEPEVGPAWVEFVVPMGVGG